ncbi:hypothetical protein D3C75_936150 [compost metagenome]
MEIDGIKRIHLITQNILLPGEDQHGTALAVCMVLAEYIPHGLIESRVPSGRSCIQQAFPVFNGQAVALATDRPDLQTLQRGQFFPQPVNMIIHRPFHRIFHRPHMIQKLLPGERAALIAVEKHQ